MDTRKQIAELIFPEPLPEIEAIYEKYPARTLRAEAMVTRIGPSPTGFFHIGGVYAALISEKLAHQTGGVFYLRIEDTDKKREVEGATDLIIASLRDYGIKTDEGEIQSGQEVGEYGPYKQSGREKIYKAFVKKLLETGEAYPCFATTEELEVIHTTQTEQKIRPGYYGQWAIWRNKTPEEVLARLAQGAKPVIRLKSAGNAEKTIQIEDMFRGSLELPENDQDIVLLKTEGLPTYHFAHVVDDHLMGTTHVTRGDEWLSSLTLHIQLFNLMGWKCPTYGHLAPIQKMDGASRRKLSKRHDPEASVTYYSEVGYPPEAVVAYLLNLANSSFEEWYRTHPGQSPHHYQLSLTELKKGAGALLDLQKLTDISKDYIANLSPEESFRTCLVWAQTYDNELATMMAADKDYTHHIFNIERNAGTARKNIGKWSDVKEHIGFFFDDIFGKIEIQINELADISPEDTRQIITSVIEVYDTNDSKDVWLAKMTKIAETLGYAPDIKTYKKDPSAYKGHFGSVAKVIRVLLVGKNQSPDLYEIMRIMGRPRVLSRLSKYKQI